MEKKEKEKTSEYDRKPGSDRKPDIQIPDIQQLGNRIRQSVLEAIQISIEEKVMEDLKRRLFISVIFVVPMLLIAFQEEAPGWGLAAQAGLAIPILAANHRVFVDGFSSIRKGRPEKNTLGAIGTLAALATIHLTAAGIFLTTMAVCRYTEAYIRLRLEEHLVALAEAEPGDPGYEAGQIITVRRGAVIPADGVIEEGETTIDEELITGERVPVAKGEGENAFAGMKNLGGDIRMRVLRCGRETTISRIIDHVTASIATKPPISARAEKVARVFVLIVLIFAVLLALMMNMYGAGWETSVTTAVTILLIASPYAFSGGVPMAITGASVRGAKNGMLIRSADILELARDINTIAMNKTGTVTNGKAELSDVISLSGGFSLRLAGALEQASSHPFGQEVYRTAMKEYGRLQAAEDVEIIRGRGIKGRIGGKLYFCGNAVLMEERGISINVPEAESLFTQGKSVIYYADEKRVIGLIGLRDSPKAVSVKGISRIEGMGIDTVMITGDNRQTAEAIGNEVGIDQVRAQIRHEEKAGVIGELRSQGGVEKVVAMVGNGVDDAEAIAMADIGFAIGTGPDINIRPADVILISDDLMDVVKAISLSRKTIRVIRQNLAFAYCYNIVAILAAAFVLVPAAGTVLAPGIAAVCMCAGQILVTASTMRVKKARL